MRSHLRPRLSTSDLRLLRSSPSVFLAYCGLRASLRDISADGDPNYGLIIFIVPEGYRLEDYRRAAGYLFVDDEEIRWNNPGRSRRVYQAPAIKPAKGIAQEISIFDLPDARVLVARNRADVPEEVLFATAAVIDVTRPLPLHIIAVRRLLRLPALLPEVIEDLCQRSQELVLAAILRRECAASDLKALERQIPDGTGARMLANLPGFDAVKAWAATVVRDILLWRGGTLPWSEVTKGALLSGPPGTGKTLFAQAFADACGLKLVTASVGDWEEAGYLNHTLAAMRESFEAAIAANGAVLFIDEFDGLSRRDGLKGEYAHYRRIVINHFLQLSSRPVEGVILLGATNYPEAIDPAT